MKLQLNRTISFFDIESTHKDPQKARIIELGIIQLHPDGTTNTIRLLFNPDEVITAENTAIHGFTNDIVKDEPLFSEKAAQVAEIFKDTDLGTFNGNSYDIPLLSAEFVRAGYSFSFDGMDFVDVGNLFKILAPRTLTQAVSDYLNKDHAGAHGAIADTQATIDVLLAMIDKHGEAVPLEVDKLAFKSNYDKRRLDIDGKFIFNSLGVMVFTFGKWKDEPVFKNKDYVKWMLDAKDKVTGKPVFSHDTRNFCGLILNGMDLTTDFKTVEHKPAFRRF